ncbi:MAG: alcohol dehydrogenase catalytic domain-containing protein [Chloroflexi bacterium]|nr:alcohol dehydrogenase catalytic domain-containing protein [Chloroflexota bacterium]
MKIKAAILWGFKQPLKVEDVELDAPGQGEVLVKLVGAGVCHTDLSVAEGVYRAPVPIVLGHEGAGIVERTGRGVTTLKRGDHVILTGAASCGKCPACMKGKPTLCEVFSPALFGGILPGGHKRLHKNGQPLNHFFAQSSFAEYAVVPQEAAIKIRDDAPLETLGPLGCSGITGLGSVLNAAQVKIGSSVAVFGCGGVGMSAIMGARLAGATKIIAIDLLPRRLKLAGELGATHTINVAKRSPVAQIKRLTGGGADYAIVAVRSAAAIRQAIECIPSGGRVIIVGGAPQGTTVDLAAIGILAEKTIRGVLMGSGQAAFDIPHYVDLFMDGRLPLDRIVTHRYPLNEINEAFKASHGGEAIKPVIMF